MNGMDPLDKPYPYQAYVLRCWAERSNCENEPVWRFSLEPVSGGRRLGFPDLEKLVDFLRRETDWHETR